MKGWPILMYQSVSAVPMGHAKFVNAPPLGLTRLANAL